MKQQEYKIPEIDFGQLHESVFPADVRQGENLRASFRPVGQSSREFIEARVWRLSPIGIELIVERADAPLRAAKVDLILVIGGQRTSFEGVVVEGGLPHESATRIGIRLSRVSSTQTGEDRRSNNRWLCSSQYHPTAVSQNPAKFNDYLYFKLRDISVDGVQLITSLRNKFILPGMRFELEVSLPMIGQVRVGVTVARIGFALENGKDYLVVGASFSNMSNATKNVIGQYLLQFGERTSLEELRDSGFFPPSIGNAIQYTFLKDEEDYRQVLKLRHLSYSKAGKLDAESSVDDMADLFDSRSRIIVGRYNGQVVATSRLTFAELGQKLEIDQDLDWHSDFPRRDEVVEVSRTCTSPEFRGGDLLMSLLKQIAIAAVQAKREWIIIGASEDLKPLYSKIGFSGTGQYYNHHSYKGLKHEVMLGNTPSVMKGIGVGPLVWHAVWKDVSQYLVDSELVKIDGLSVARLSIYKALAPIAAIASRHIRRPRKARVSGASRKSKLRFSRA